MRIPYLSSMQVGLRRILMVLAVTVLSLYFFTLTPLFEHQLEKQVIAGLEHATGARVHIREFHASIWTRQLVLRDIAMRRAAGDIPFFTAESVLVQLRFATIFQTDKELRLLRMQKPRFEIVFDAQGRSNLPEPGVARPDPRRSPLDPLFTLAIRRLEVIDGLWIWEDKAHKIDFNLERTTASLSYDPARDRYTGILGVHAMGMVGRQQQPFTWTAQIRFVLEHRALQVTEAAFEAPHSSIRAQLMLRDFRNPVVQAGYSGALDVAEVGALLNSNALREGRVTAKGSAHFEAAKGGLHVTGEARTAFGQIGRAHV